ncbi:DUF58 domain-containing protein [Laceyella putida]|uniref:DUF58 domain-containing protein n=1 Tax=Laceyella putida TaxID=110101 RepID=A0ABW2RLK8_9BACL
MRQNKGWWMLVALSVGWGGLYWWYGGKVTGFFFYMFLGLAGYAGIGSFMGLRGVRVQRALSTQRCVAGDRLEVKLTVERTGWMPWVDVMIYDLYTPAQASSKEQKGFLLTSSREQTESYSVYHARRGRYRFHGIQCRVGDVFGFMEREVVHPQQETVVVYPRFPSLTVPLFPFSQGRRMNMRHQQEDASVVTGLRPYQPGDRLQEIDWKSSARGQGLKVKKRVDNQATEQVVILLDQRAEAYCGLPDDVFEWGVSAVASLSHEWLHNHLPVTVAFTGAIPHVMKAESVQPHFFSLMDRLVDVKADGEGGLMAWRGLSFPIRSTLVAITPQPDEGFLRLMMEWRRHREVIVLQLAWRQHGQIKRDAPIPIWDVWIEGQEWQVGRRGWHGQV